jgi:soluble lytic murein transglycosylase-like protein
MQTFWQHESDRRTWLYLLLVPAITACLLTGTAYGSGMVGSELIGSQDLPIPGRKPAGLIEASLPAAEELAAGAAVPAPDRKPPFLTVSPDETGSGPAPEATDETATPSRTTVTAAGVPVPGRKPGQTRKRPDVLSLLSFGPAKAGDIQAETTKTATAKTAIVATVAGPAPIPARKPLRNAAALTAPRAALPGDDAALYKMIFAAQAKGDWDEADRAIDGLADRRLMGHVLYQRFMHPSYKTSFSELENWLVKYADHPGADKIYRMAVQRTPAGYVGTLRKPHGGNGITGYLSALDDGSLTYSAAATRSRAQQRDVNTLLRAIRHDVAQGAPTRALKRAEQDRTAKLLDEIETDQVRAHIAMGYMNAGKVKKAYELASAAAKRSGSNVPMAGWTGGLTAWRLGKYKQSAALFEQVAASPFTSPWMTAAGAYWASRAHMRLGHTREVSKWLRLAASQPRTFYGLIATRALGWDFDFNWRMPALTAADKAKLDNLPAARRAMALVAAGQYHLAEEELRQVNPGKDSALRDALLAYAHDAGLPAFAMRLAEAIPGPDGSFFDAALYPLAPWEPQGGFAVDRALIHAIIRQESRFDPAAESASGATGLMQLMPRTASYVAKDRAYRDRDGQHSLKDPQINLEIGQRYVANLLKDDAVSADLFSLAIAYNAGPGNLRKWKAAFADTTDDPLLFVETIPVAETRAFVERVLSNYWIYRLRMEQKTPSLDAVAAGAYARYVSLDKDNKDRKPFRFAANG